MHRGTHTPQIDSAVCKGDVLYCNALYLQKYRKFKIRRAELGTSGLQGVVQQMVVYRRSLRHRICPHSKNRPKCSDNAVVWFCADIRPCHCSPLSI